MYIGLDILLNYLVYLILVFSVALGILLFFNRNKKVKLVNAPLKTESTDIFQLKGNFDESSFTAMLANIPDEEESAKLTKKRDEEFMFYDNMDDWVKGNKIILTDDTILNRIKPFVVKYCKVPVVSYEGIPYMMETIMYKKNSKTGLTNVIKTKFAENNILLYSIVEDGPSIVIKYARIEKEFN